MEFTCFHCNTVTKLDVKIDATFFSCPNCATHYSKNNDNQFFFKDKLKKNPYNNAFSIGQKAELNGDNYTIIGVLVKKNNSGYRWAEYILENTTEEEYIYISESEGNFILLKQIDFEQKVGNHPVTIDYEGLTFDRFDYTYPELEYAAGYFDFNILNKIEQIEYINPPYILSFEKFGNEQTCFYGKHISRSKVKRAFQTNDIPSKSEIGMVQPFFISFRNSCLIFCFVAILIFLTNWFINNEREQSVVLNQELSFDKYINQDFISNSFELKGSSAPLQISASSSVDNSWANIQIALINEKTNEEIYASKDIEYYHGYTDGENWSEGSKSEDFNICGVAAGNYHLRITPIKAREDLVNSSVNVVAIWNSPSLRNAYMTILFMGILVIIIYYFSKQFEEKRWGND